MAKNGEVIAAWSDAHQAYIAFVTQEDQIVDGKFVTQAVEHSVALPLRGRVDANNQPLEDLADMDDATKLDILLQHVVAKRDAQFTDLKTDIDTANKKVVNIDVIRAADIEVIKE